MNWKKHIKRLLYIFLSAFVLMFFSEYFFLNEEPAISLIESLRNESSFQVLLGLLEFTMIYAFFGYILFIAVDRFKINDLFSLFLAGILFGWWTEGIIIGVVYEAIPWSIAWPSIGWHAVVDVLVGYYFVRKILQKNNYLLTTALAIGMGIFWGFWATWFWGEGVEAIASNDFSLYAFFLTAILIASYFLLDRLQPKEIHITNLGIVIFSVLSLAGLILISFQFGILPWITLAPLTILTFFLLHQNRSESHSNILSTRLAGKAKLLNVSLLFLMPIIASILYRWIYANDIQLPIGEIIPPLLMVIGGAAYIISILRILIRKN